MCHQGRIFTNHVTIHRDKITIKGVGGFLISEGYVYLILKAGNAEFKQRCRA